MEIKILGQEIDGCSEEHCSGDSGGNGNRSAKDDRFPVSAFAYQFWELDTARHAIRPDKEYDTAQRLQAAYGKKFAPEILAQSQKNVAETLDEPAEPVSIREKLQQSIQQANKHRRTNRLDQVR